MEQRQIHLYINGQWVPTVSGQVVEDRDPSDGSLYAMAHLAGPAEAEAAMAAAEGARVSWAATMPDERERLLLRAADRMESHLEEFTEVMIAETGSAYLKARGEVLGGANVFRVAAGECRRLNAEMMPPNLPGQFSMSIRVPLGIVLGIMPFNYPLILAVKKLAYAIAAGNTFIQKSSPLTPAAGAIIAQVMDEAGFPAGVYNLLAAQSDVVANQLIDDPRIRMVTFTGSTRAGQQIAGRCACHIKPYIMELGGKNPLIVLKDYEVDHASEIACYGAFSHQGQLCMATSRLIVEEPSYEAFCQAMKTRAETLTVGNAHDRNNLLGPLIDGSKCAWIDAQIADAVSKGARVLTGGTHEGPFYRPTVLADVTPEMDIFHQETFGPVTSIVRAADPEHALALCNQNVYGLTAALLTHNLELAWSLGTRIEAGSVHINNSSYISSTVAPFGGSKLSGVGREGGHHSMEAYTELRWLTMQTTQRKMPF